MRVFLATLLFALASPAFAQERMPVYVNYSGSDTVGQRLKYQLSQALARSATLRSSANTESALIVVNLNTLASPAGGSYQTVYGVSYLLKDFNGGLDGYLSSNVGFCGTDRLTECAESIVADVDSERAMILEIIANSAQADTDQGSVAFH